jgi:hypothetical protein
MIGPELVLQFGQLVDYADAPMKSSSRKYRLRVIKTGTPAVAAAKRPLRESSMARHAPSAISPRARRP